MSARLSQDLAQVLEIESSRRCADTQKREKYDRDKESSRSAEKILGSEESTAKSSKSPARVLEGDAQILRSGERRPK